MSFFIRRYLYGVTRRSGWLLLAFAPLLLYILGNSMIPDRFLVQQGLPIVRTSPVSVTSSPVDVISVNDLIMHPEEFFQDTYALIECGKNLDINLEVVDESHASKILRSALAKDVSIKADGENVLIGYLGPERKLGEKIVQFYSQRLVDRVDQGSARTQVADNRGASVVMSPAAQKSDAAQSIASAAPEVKTLAATIKISPSVLPLTALWRPERGFAATMIFCISLVLVLVLLGALEWIDPAFKSERQVARYLGVRIAGGIPDLNRLRSIVRKPKAAG